jgi:hypothetical protein
MSLDNLLLCIIDSCYAILFDNLPNIIYKNDVDIDNLCDPPNNPAQ